MWLKDNLTQGYAGSIMAPPPATRPPPTSPGFKPRTLLSSAPYRLGRDCKQKEKTKETVSIQERGRSPGRLKSSPPGSQITFCVLLTCPYLAFNDMHEAGHQLWTLQEEVKVVEDDLWVPGKRGSRRQLRRAEGKNDRTRRKTSPTDLVTKHLSTSSCLQTNSMNQGDVILMEDGQDGEEREDSR